MADDDLIIDPGCWHALTEAGVMLMFALAGFTVEVLAP